MLDLRICCDEHNFSDLSAAFKNEAECDVPAALEIVFLDKEHIKKLNAEYRQVDKCTDVLSFPTLENICGKPICGDDYPFDKDDDGNLFLGSIAICTDVAREQAEEYGHSYERELYYLATHGVCHLLGYDHIEEDDKALMRAVEERVMQTLNLTR